MNHKTLLTGGLTLFVVACMVGAAEVLGQPEIIFPEITALAVGALIAPKRTWQTNRTRMLLLIALCAVAGILIVRYIPLPLWLQMSLAFVLCQILYLFSKTTFAPMISAMVLPVLLGTRSVVYPVAAIALTGLVLALQWALERAGVKEAEPFVPVAYPGRSDFWDLVIRTVCAVSLIAVALGLGWRFIVAPPLLVAFTEFTRRTCPARVYPGKAIALVALCALSGAVCRLLFTVQFRLPLTLSAVIATLLMLFLLHRFGMFLPPAGALTILAMLVPESALTLYPLQILIGISAAMGLALGLFRQGVPGGCADPKAR